MNANLDGLRTSIHKYLDEREIAIFYCFPRAADLGLDAVYWDTDQHPDFQGFVNAAQALGIRLMTVHSREFDTEVLDEVLSQLADAVLDRKMRRGIEAKVAPMRAFQGYICQIELSFDYAQRTYVLDLRAEWYDELNDLIDLIGENPLSPSSGAADSSPEKPLGGYYSNN